MIQGLTQTYIHVYRVRKIPNDKGRRTNGWDILKQKSSRISSAYEQICSSVKRDGHQKDQIEGYRKTFEEKCKNRKK